MMAMLHVVNKSPFEKVAFNACLGHVKAGDTVLLIEDAVVGAVDGSMIADQVKSAMSDVTVCVLGGDYAARGMKEDRMIEGIKVVDYAGFVDLTAENDKVQSWL